MEYAAGGELFERICKNGRFSENEVTLQLSLFLSPPLFLQCNGCIFCMVSWLWFLVQARFFFQQLISGVSYCHAMVLVPFSFIFSIYFRADRNWNFRLFVLLFNLDEASMSPWLEAGEHIVGWQSCSPFEDLWFWVLQGNCYLSLAYSLFRWAERLDCSCIFTKISDLDIFWLRMF